MYDLAWIIRTSAAAKALDLRLIRRLAILKIWVDSNRLRAGTMVWGQAHEGSVFDPERWLRPRDEREFDLEDIGALATPVPSAKSLCDTVRIGFAFLEELTDDERILSRSDERDRSLAIRLIRNLPGGRLSDVKIY